MQAEPIAPQNDQICQHMFKLSQYQSRKLKAGHCKQLAMLFSRSTFRALTLGGSKPYSQMAGSGSGMVLTFALAQLLRKVPGNARVNGGSGSRLGLVPPH